MFINRRAIVVHSPLKAELGYWVSSNGQPYILNILRPLLRFHVAKLLSTFNVETTLAYAAAHWDAAS